VFDTSAERPNSATLRARSDASDPIGAAPQPGGRRRALQTLAALGVTGLAGIAPESARAQAWPSRPITIIVPFPPGGVTDLVGRELARKLSESLGQSVVVENRPGAGGNIGTQALARAPADGHTLGVLTVSAMSIAPYVQKTLGFVPARDFTPITNMVNTPGAVIAGPKVPFGSLAELVKAAQAQPGKVSYASVGAGSIPHLTAEMLSRELGIQMLHVPYKGAAPAMQDLLAGVVDLSFETALTNVVTQQAAGKIRVLAITGPQRVTALPGVPTVAESGYPGFSAQGWFGFFGPAGLPPDVTRRLNEIATGLLREPALRERFDKLGILPDPRTPAEFSAFLQEQDRRWSGVAKGLNLQLD
jgi:tripartite-type tricarboxylate transporter receptor subunit TctC